MYNNDNDAVYEGESGITCAVGKLDDTLPPGKTDRTLHDLWSTNSFNAGDTLTLHVANDAMGRLWTLRTPTLSVTRLVEQKAEFKDLAWRGNMEIHEGIRTYGSGFGMDNLLTLLNMTNSFSDKDVFTIHYHNGKSQPSWSLETSDNLIFSKPKAYPEKS